MIYISYSQVQTYLTCSQKWWWEQQKWKPLLKPDELAFGIAVHAAIDTYMVERDFAAATALFDQTFIREKKGQTPLELLEAGPRLLKKLIADETFLQLEASGKTELKASKQIAPDVTLRGRIDYYGGLKGAPVIVDWKTAAYPYTASLYQVMGDQLTTYKLLTDCPPETKFGYCVIGKKNFLGKDPQWIWVTRSEEDVAELVAKMTLIAHRMAAGEHFKEFEEYKCTKKCDFLELCLKKTPTKVAQDEF